MCVNFIFKKDQRKWIIENLIMYIILLYSYDEIIRRLSKVLETNNYIVSTGQRII